MKLNELTAGKIFADEFRVIRPLEVGGMGAIYEVEQLSTGSTRALKLMLPEIVSSPKQRERFDREARAAGRIESDHVVQVVAAGVDTDSEMPWLAMELLKGEHLASYVRRLGPQSPEKCDAIFGQLCHAVAAAHRVGIVHRDLKPENIFISPSRIEGTPFFVKVLDFGIARITELAKTKRTDAAGTPLWMAPEQTTAGAQIGPATDVWALGLIAFWLLTGRYYWLSANTPDTNAFAVIRELISDELESASARARRFGSNIQLPEHFDAWFARCVQRDTQKRFVDAAELRATLPAALGLPSPTRGTSLATEQEPMPPTAAKGPPPEALLGSAAGTADYLAAAGFDDVSSNQTQNATAPGPSRSNATVAATPPDRHTQPTGPGYTQPTPSGMAATSAERPSRSGTGGRSKALMAIGVGFLAAAALAAGLWFQLRDTDGQICLAAEANGPAAEVRTEACERACKQGETTCCAALADLYRTQLDDHPQRADTMLESYQAACDGNDLTSCRKLGELYQRGGHTAIAPHTKQAQQLLKKACDAKDARGCTALAVEQDYMRGSDRNVTQVMSLYQQGCRGGDALGCSYAAMLLFSGRGLHKDVARATTLANAALKDLETGCDDGDMAECTAVGTMATWGLGTRVDNTRAATLFQQACDHGFGAACNNLGVVYARGTGVMKQGPRAMAEFERACQRQTPAGCNNLGAMDAPYRVVTKLGVEGATVLKHNCERELRTGCTLIGDPVDISPNRDTDVEAAATAYRKACRGGEPHACVNLGGMTLYGRGVEYDKSAAMTLFQQACDAGNPSGCGELGSLYTSIGALRDVSKGNALMERACTWGESDACVARAWHRKEGVGEKDPAAAAAVLRKVCDEGSIFACYALGLLVEEGAGVKKSLPEAWKLLTQACDGGRDDACVQVARFHLTGIFVKRDVSKGVALLEKMCELGNYDGCVMLAQQLVTGVGIAKDAARATALLKSSCEHHHGAACHELGYNYFMGNRGVDKDPARAIQLLTQACDYNAAHSCFNLGVVFVDAINVERDVERGKEYLHMACDAALEQACKKLKQVK